jgi:hypothetical protein
MATALKLARAVADAQATNRTARHAQAEVVRKAQLTDEALEAKIKRAEARERDAHETVRRVMAFPQASMGDEDVAAILAEQSDRIAKENRKIAKARQRQAYLPPDTKKALHKEARKAARALRRSTKLAPKLEKQIAKARRAG